MMQRLTGQSRPDSCFGSASPEAVKFKVREIIILPLAVDGAQADKVSFEKSIHWSTIWPAQAFKRSFVPRKFGINRLRPLLAYPKAAPCPVPLLMMHCCRHEP
jgi:hypothetical protein